MPAGWNQTSGTFREGAIDEDTFWMLFNYVFSDSSAKRTTYKFGLIKSILDNLFNSEGEDYSLTDFMSIIDFGKDSVTLRYNLSLSNSWNKDFTETKYLGGAIQGDWNPAVSRTGSIKATVSIKEDPMMENPEETIEAMRRLAVYAGVCHVRTPDGSGYYANVDVQEDREEKWVTQLAKFSLNITRVDPPEVKYTMRTKAEWEEDQEDEE